MMENGNRDMALREVKHMLANEEFTENRGGGRETHAGQFDRHGTLR